MTMSPMKKTWAGLVFGLSIAGFAFAATPAQAAASGTYITQQGDTFWKVSKKLNISLQELLNVNSGISPYNVYPGLHLKLPGTTAHQRTAPHTVKLVKAAASSKLSYSKHLNAVASAYTGSAAENGGWAGLDYQGNPLRFGTIAVDPKVIPLGSKVYVTGYKFNGMPAGGFVATASDIGGAIQGNRIDIFLPNSIPNAVNFGIQNVNLYVLK